MLKCFSAFLVDSSDKEKVMANGFNGYVPKPVDAHILKEKLHSTIKQTIAAE